MNLFMYDVIRDAGKSTLLAHISRWENHSVHAEDIVASQPKGFTLLEFRDNSKNELSGSLMHKLLEQTIQ